MNFFLIIDRLVIGVGRYVINSIINGRKFVQFLITTLKHFPFVFKNFHFSVEQMHIIGITSIPLVATTSIFTGGVVAIQSITQFGDYLPLRYSGMVVGKSVMLELGPVLTGLVVAGRVGAAMTAEIGTMAVTEQIDAMRCLNLNPFRYLIAPRLLAGMVMLPVLTIFSSFIAIMGALAIVYFLKDMSPAIFFSGVRLFYSDRDMLVSLMKAFTFGIVITSFGCFFGYFSTHGAEGVGKATRSSVVASDITILISGYVVSYLLLGLEL
jgi:phospholipid/cholesterol/gamma-HCH transport system permease protein